jgi:hypothetical protein
MKINVNQLRMYESGYIRLRPLPRPEERSAVPYSEPRLADMFMVSLYDPNNPNPSSASRPGFLLDRYI